MAATCRLLPASLSAPLDRWTGCRTNVAGRSRWSVVGSQGDPEGHPVAPQDDRCVAGSGTLGMGDLRGLPLAPVWARLTGINRSRPFGAAGGR
jgi:hypothetical protein